MNVLDKLQAEMKPWQAHNFPDRPDWVPLMGAVEEAGELQDADFPDGTLDAIGDIAIYLADYANAKGYSLSECMEHAIKTGNRGSVHLIVHLGNLAHSHIKSFQNIRRHEDHVGKAKESIGLILCYLDNQSVSLGMTLDEVVDLVWSKVSKRDWQKNRDTSHIQPSTPARRDLTCTCEANGVGKPKFDNQCPKHGYVIL